MIAHVHRVGDDEREPRERFLVAEVHDGQITDLRGYATEPEARDALHAVSSPDGVHITAFNRSTVGRGWPRGQDSRPTPEFHRRRNILRHEAGGVGYRF